MPYDLAYVVKAFKNLNNLEVCDDVARIEIRIKEMMRRKLWEGKQPGLAGVAAKEWEKDVTEIRTKRKEMLEVVYASFKQGAKTYIDAAIVGGNDRLSRKLSQDIVDAQRGPLNLDKDLAWAWFERRFCPEEGLKIGGDLVSPDVIERFEARSGRDKIVLTWQKPPKNCDEVEIVREADGAPPDKRTKVGPTWSKRVTGNSYDDGEAAAGVWYTYRAFPCYKGARGDVPKTDRAIRWVEVSNVRPKASVTHVDLEWKPPSQVASIKVFKRKRIPPKLRRGARGWEADDGETGSYDGGRETWRDTHVEEGSLYHYRIVVDFGSGVVSDGVEIAVEVPRRPADVSTLIAEYKPEQGKDQVVLTWPRAQAGSPAKYVVVRREGKIPPLSTSDGKVFGPLAQTGYVDREVVSGCCYTYAVFACVDELYSRCGRTAPAVAILSDVRELRTSEGDGSVELHWLTPENLVDVVVRRDLAPPPDHRAGKAVSVLSKQAGKPGLAKDSGLENEKTYYYLVRCEYKLGAGEVAFSKGVAIKAKPVTAPDPIKDFEVTVIGHAVHCSWTPPAHGQVLVRTHGQPVAYPREASIDTDEVLRLGRPLVTSSGRAVDRQPVTSEPYYSIFTAAGSRAVFGGTRTAIVCPDVTDLRLTAVREGVRLEWVWPTECTAVRIVRRLGDWPRGPNDPGAIVLSKVEYRNAGDYFLDPIHQQGGHYYYIVYARVCESREVLFSSGTNSGCRADIEFSRLTTLKYRLKPEASGNPGPQGILLEWDVDDPFAECAEFVLVANDEHHPKHPADGEELLRWKPSLEDAGKKHLTWIALEPIRRRGWARFFCKVFTADPEQGRLVLIVHPDVCIVWSSAGRPRESAEERPPGYHRSGVPRTVICPKCFQEFSLAEMRYADADGHVVAGRYRLIDRLLRRPLPPPPRDAHGGNYTVKLCPKGHQLPFNTGTQNSLVIGLIGARSSGKSHYIASLIDRLQGSAGNDMQAGLMPVTDETADRYKREFYDPLFVKHLQLPATPRLPPPLIYELSIDGALWGQKQGRSVTLALYDTAGEDLNDSQVVQQMLLYLHVASGIMLLADPLQMPGVRQLLSPSSLPPPLQDADPNPILNRVTPVLQQRRLVTQAGTLTLPLAVVLTKCDALRDAGLIEQNRVWHTNLRHVGYFNRQIHDDMHGMMGEYLQRWSNPVYTTVNSKFARHAFFGVSATGCAPDPSTQRFKHISPWRVEDPLLWLLAELGVVPAR